MKPGPPGQAQVIAKGYGDEIRRQNHCCTDLRLLDDDDLIMLVMKREIGD